jgi:hypothetical protein
MEDRLQWPILVAALLVVPAIVIEQSQATGSLNTIAVAVSRATVSDAWQQLVRRGSRGGSALFAFVGA